MCAELAKSVFQEPQLLAELVGLPLRIVASQIDVLAQALHFRAYVVNPAVEMFEPRQVAMGKASRPVEAQDRDAVAKQRSSDPVAGQCAAQALALL